MRERYILDETPITTHHVVIDQDVPRQIFVSQTVEFAFGPDDAALLECALGQIKADPKSAYGFVDQTTTYNFFYKPGQDKNDFIIRHQKTGCILAMNLSTALALLDALTGKTEYIPQFQDRRTDGDGGISWFDTAWKDQTSYESYEEAKEALHKNRFEVIHTDDTFQYWRRRPRTEVERNQYRRDIARITGEE